MELDSFKAKVQTYCRASGYKQARLASDAGLDSSVLSNKLNGRRKNAPFTHQEIKGIVRGLAKWGAISSREQAIELLELMDLPGNVLDSAEWSELNLSETEPKRPIHSLAVEPSPLPPCPYRGLSAFREEDAPFFFGREGLATQLLELVKEKPVVAVIGASGSGKSSLVQAGVVPQLRKENWLVVSFRPGQTPFQNLWVELLPLLDTPVSEQAFLSGEVSLATLLTPILEKRGVVLVADQFEELYTLCQNEAERQRFLEELLAVTEEGTGQTCKLVFTLRADFLGQVLAFRPLADLIQNSDLKLGPMSREELRAAALQPARLAGVEFEEGLVERIVEAVFREPGGLPLLEFELTQLWERQQDQRLLHSAYEETGGIKLALTRYADEVFACFTPPEQTRTRQVFAQLIRPGEGIADTRRVATRAELGEANWQIVQTLAEARLLVVTGSEPETVEIAHETLIEGWDRLREWMREDHTFRAWQEHLRSRLQDWQQAQKDEGLLLRSSALAEAEDWQGVRGVELSSYEREFIQASLDLRKRELLARWQRRNRIITALATGITLLVLLTSLSIFEWSEANKQRVTAEDEQQVAISNLSRALAAQSRNYYSSNQLDLGLLLSLEALRLQDSVDTRGSLLEGLITAPSLTRFMFGHSGSVESVAVSPDGKLVASASADKTIRLWEIATGKPVGQPLTGHSDLVLSVAFSPDGKTLASGSVDNTIRLWDVTTGQPIAPPLQRHTGIVYSVAFSPDGKLLASGSEDKTIRLWNLATLQPQIQPLDKHTGAVRSVAFSPDGKLLASGSTDRSIRLWDTRSGEPVGSPLVGHIDIIYSVAFSPDGKLLASGSADQTVRLWRLGDLATSPQVLENASGAVRAVAFSPNGQSLAYAGGDKTIYRWDFSTESPLSASLSGHNGTITALAFTPDSQTLISASGDSTLIEWNMETRFLARFLPGLYLPATALTFSPDGKSVLSASNDGTVLNWDTGGNLLRRAEPVSVGMVRSFAFSPNGRLLAQGDNTGTILIRDLENNKLITPPLIGHTASVNSLAFSPNGKWLASTGDDTTIRLWEVATGKPLATPWKSHTDLVFALAFSPDGKILASGSQDKTICLWDVEKGTLLRPPLTGHSEAVRSLAFSPDGKSLVSGSDKGVIILWDVATGKISGAPLAAHSAGVRYISFAPSGKTFATGSSDNTAALWDYSSRKLLGRYSGAHSGSVTAVAFSPDSNLLVTVGDDKRAILWDNNLDDWKRLACQRTNRNLSQIEWKQFFGEVPYHTTCPDLSQRS